MKTFCLVAGILAALAPWAGAAERPNFIVILSDDVGWGDFQCYNPQSKVPTPNIDRLAKGGMRFTDAHTPAALCAPTRYTMVTGNYTWRGRKANGTWGYAELPQFLPGQKTIAQMLAEAGYRTAMFGKTHFGGTFHKTASGNPDFSRAMLVGHRQWGFSYSYVLLGGHQAPPYMFMEDNRVAGDAAQVTQLTPGRLNGGEVPTAGPGLRDWDSSKVGAALLEQAIRFIDAQAGTGTAREGQRPFYIHFCTDGAHSPYTPPKDISGQPVLGVTKMTAHTDMVHEIDVLVGQIVAALGKRGLLANTLIAITSDNGGIPTERDFGHDAVGGLRGRKSSIHEGGHRVPFVVHWGDGTPAGSKIRPGSVSRQVVGVHDIVPTMAELAGARVGADQALDSVSLVPVLLGKQGDDRPIRQTLLLQSSPGRDAFTDGGPTAQQGKNAARPKAKRLAAKGAANKPQGMAARSALEKAFTQAAAKAIASGSTSDGMAHALREGAWKLVIDMTDKPAALYNLDADLAEQHNLIGDAAQAERIDRMTALYRQIRSSKRSTPPME